MWDHGPAAPVPAAGWHMAFLGIGTSFSWLAVFSRMMLMTTRLDAPDPHTRKIWASTSALFILMIGHIVHPTNRFSIPPGHFTAIPGVDCTVKSNVHPSYAFKVP